MPYHLCNHIYISQFREEVIVLDLKQDTYTICSPKFSELLIRLLKENTSDFGKDFSYIQLLIDNNIIEEQDTIFPFYTDFKPYSDGVNNIDWALPLKNEEVSLSTEVFKAIMMVIKVHSYMKIKGFYSTIQWIKNSCKNNVDYRIPSIVDLEDLFNIVNKACMIYPKRTKCLEWAITFIILALKRQWKCNLEIGVQNYPFLTHAWVECDGKVIKDSQDLRKGLSIILNEPFRKVNI